LAKKNKQKRELMKIEVLLRKQIIVTWKRFKIPKLH